MDYSRIVTVDFETERIEPRPKYPPEPVGVALRGNISMYGVHLDGSTYLSWGHPTGSNCTREYGADVLRRLWEDPQVLLLFHNAPFDVSVAVERLGLPALPWHRVHDTMLLLFLFDPHVALGLKSACETILGWAAEEQDELRDWIWTHRACLVAEYGGKITRAKSGPNSPGAWIAKAPGELVGRYARGDVDRTYKLFRHLYPIIRSEGMLEAYDRERRLMPILAENERLGLRVDLDGLGSDVPMYTKALQQVEVQMRQYLRTPDLSFDNDRDVAAAFGARGAIHEDQWVRTKTGQLSVAKDNLPPEAFTDPLMASAFGYRNRLVTCLKMFLLPWIEQAEVNDGRVHTSWNQVRGSRGGARTGRPSMSRPNLLNVSKSWDDRTDGYVHPAALDLPELPLVRKYVMSDADDNLFVHRDFSGQEVRIFAHFECGDLASAYRRDPDLDPHSWLMAEIEKTTGRVLERTRVKNVTFARLYGGGKNSVYQQARCTSLAEAKEIMDFHDRALPGRKILSEEIQRIVRRGEPIRTWGGRLYDVEPPSVVNGRRQTWEYKLINYLVQGSAADVTKEAICRWYEGGGTADGSRFLLTVYDEINISSPRAAAAAAMENLREVMEGIEMDVPMRSDGKWGERWGTLTKYTGSNGG